MKEEWKDIIGYEEVYQVSNFGRIKSFKNNKEVILKTNPCKVDGYCRKVLYCSEGKYKAFLLHRLVAHAFLVNPENKSEVNHLNLDKTDNNVYNLEWVTPSENTKHAFSNRYIKRDIGEDVFSAVLNEDQVRQIRVLHKTGRYRYKDIGDIFNVSYNTIGAIMRGQTWKHVK